MPLGDIPEPKNELEEVEQLASAIAASLHLGDAETGPSPSAGEAPQAEGGGSSEAASRPLLPVGCGAEPGEEPPPLDELEAVQVPVEIGQGSHEFTSTTRFYAVWSLSKAGGGREFSGVHAGEGTEAYKGLIALNGGSWGGIRWRRFGSYDEAITGFIAERAKHKFSGDPTVWQWSSQDGKREPCRYRRISSRK